MTKVTRLSWVAIVSLLVLNTVPLQHAQAGPPDERVEPLKDKLGKLIKVEFLDTPLERVIESLEREADGVTFVLDRNGLAGSLKVPVSLRAEKMSIRRALDWVTVGAAADWDVRDGLVYITTPDEAIRPYIKLQVYDVRSLIARIPQFVGAPQFDLNSALSNTSSGGSAGQGVAQASTDLFADDSPDVDVSGITSEDLVEIIEASVRRGKWHEIDGVSVNVRNGILTVVHTDDIQDQVKALLEQYQKAYGKMVSLEAHFLVVKREKLEEHLAKTKGSALLAPDAVEAFLKTARAEQAGGRVLGVARTTCFNAQRVNLSASSDESFVSDLEPIPGAAGMDPTVSVSKNGVVLDIEPAVSFDDSSITIVLRSHVVLGRSMSSHRLPVVTPPDMLKEHYRVQTPTEKGKADKVTTRDKTRITAAESALVGIAEVQLPKQDTVNYKTTVRLANGGGVILSGFTSQFEQVELKDAEVVLLVRAATAK